MNRRDLVGSFLVATVAAALIPTPALSQGTDAELTMGARLLAHAPAIGERSVGTLAAPVVVVEYASATCPHCAQFHVQVWPQIRQTYVETGKVRWIFREFPLDSLAMAAFMLARCVPPDEYFPTIDLIFERQKLWSGAQADARKELFNIMKHFGMDQDTFDECIQRKELAEAIYMVAKTANVEFDVKSTPTFFLNGQLIRGTQDFATFGSMIDAELARSGN